MKKLKVFYKEKLDCLYVGGDYMRGCQDGGLKGLALKLAAAFPQLALRFSRNEDRATQIENYLQKLVTPPIWDELDGLDGKTLLCSCPFPHRLCHASLLLRVIRMKKGGLASSRDILLSTLGTLQSCEGGERARSTLAVQSCGSGDVRHVGETGVPGFDDKRVCTLKDRNEGKFVLLLGNSQFRTFATAKVWCPRDWYVLSVAGGKSKHCRLEMEYALENRDFDASRVGSARVPAVIHKVHTSWGF